MALPVELKDIFKIRNKSYKMVLVLSLIDEMNHTGQWEVPLENVKHRFLSHLQDRERHGLPVDQPPSSYSNWNEMTVNNVQSVISTPIRALSSIIEQDFSGDKIAFRHNWNQDVLNELYEKAKEEINEYYKHVSDFSLHNALHRVMSEYVSAKRDPFRGHPLGHFVRRQIPEGIRSLPFIHEYFKVQGSVGMGNWADVPWIAIMDRRITETTQEGEYIVYLFSEDMKSVYLTLAQGVTKPKKERGKAGGYQYLQQKVQQLRNQLPLEGLYKDDQIYLKNEGLGQDYQVSTVAYYRYDYEHLPEDEVLVRDLENLVQNYNQYVDSVVGQNSEEESAPVTLTINERIQYISNYIKNKGFTYPDYLIENFYLSLKSKPFVILAGVSGTGKTKLVKLFAEAVGATSENKQFTLIPVRPDWSDPTDLLGYKDLTGKFRPGPFTEVILEAIKPENRNKPFFVCLDEMNLARVEHYFSDLLSVIETQQWKHDEIVTDSFLRFDTENGEVKNLYLPDNVYIIGTVNMDETTYPFSKKVLDRANTIEFNYIQLDHFPTLMRSEFEIHPADNSFLRADYLQLRDVFEEYEELIRDTTETLVRMNKILESIHSHVGFRIRDAICFYLIYNDKYQLMTEDQAFDFQMLQKLLPRIQGSNLSVKKVLLELLEIALDKKLAINELIEDSSNMYSTYEDEIANAKYPQSAKKLLDMLRRLEEDGFTSYWLS